MTLDKEKFERNIKPGEWKYIAGSDEEDTVDSYVYICTARIQCSLPPVGRRAVNTNLYGSAHILDEDMAEVKTIKEFIALKDECVKDARRSIIDQAQEICETGKVKAEDDRVLDCMGLSVYQTFQQSYAEVAA